MKDMPMNCKRARANIALWVGHDLDEVTCHQLERHLATCPSCRDHRERMQTGLTVLSEIKYESTAKPAGSLWPAVSSRLSACDAQLRAPRFNGWVPAIAVAGIFLAIVSIANMPDPTPQFRTLVPGQTIDFSSTFDKTVRDRQRERQRLEGSRLYDYRSPGSNLDLPSSR